MMRKLAITLCLALLPAVAAAAETEPSAVQKPAGQQEAKELSGMSIVGNDEAPKSLYIVPWKSSELGVQTGLNMMLNDSDVPVDREVFMRQLAYYEVLKAAAQKQ